MRAACPPVDVGPAKVDGWRAFLTPAPANDEKSRPDESDFAVQHELLIFWNPIRLGADEASLPLLWLAAPLTGLLVQPIIGHMSDRTWCRLGRRRPVFCGFWSVR